MCDLAELQGEKGRYRCLLLSWVVPDQDLLFQEFRMLQDAAMSESRGHAGLQAHAPWKVCGEETPEETSWSHQESTETYRQGVSIKGPASSKHPGFPVALTPSSRGCLWSGPKGIQPHLGGRGHSSRFALLLWKDWAPTSSSTLLCPACVTGSVTFSLASGHEV